MAFNEPMHRNKPNITYSVRNELPEMFDNLYVKKMILFMITGQDKTIHFIFQQ